MESSILESRLPKFIESTFVSKILKFSLLRKAESSPIIQLAANLGSFDLTTTSSKKLDRLRSTESTLAS